MAARALSGFVATSLLLVFFLFAAPSASKTTPRALSKLLAVNKNMLTGHGALSVTTLSLPGAIVGISYSTSLAASGGTAPYTWDVTDGSLPSGVVLSSSGVISGTPESPGATTFTVQVSDSTTPTPDITTATLSITVVATSAGHKSSNWSGYVIASGASPITEVSGEWTVPTLDCSATPKGEVGIWVGIGGVPDRSKPRPLLQTGIMASCIGHLQSDIGWWQTIPMKPNRLVPFADFFVSPGDSMRASVFEQANRSWETRIVDLTTGWSGYMVTGHRWGTSLPDGSAFTQGSAADVSYPGGSTAEWIVEDPAGGKAGKLTPFGDYGAVTFSDLRTSYSPWSLTPTETWRIVRGTTILSAPSAPSAPTTGFSVVYTGGA